MGLRSCADVTDWDLGNSFVSKKEQNTVNCWFGREEGMGGFPYLYFITYSTTYKEEAVH